MDNGFRLNIHKREILFFTERSNCLKLKLFSWIFMIIQFCATRLNNVIK